MRFSLSVACMAAAAALALLAGCAHQVTPTGGPIDKQRPRVLASVPASGSVSQPQRGRLTLRFSEWVEPKSAEKSVSVFPLPPGGVKVRVNGRSLEIAPAQAWDSATTYHAELNAALLDLNGNSIGTPYHLVFSTGPVLDSGAVEGCIIDPALKQLQPKVALFAAKGELPDSAYLSLPTYVTQTDSSARFSISHVRRGVYDLIAFVDRNNDSRLQPGEGEVFAPVNKRFSIDTVRGPLLLFPIGCDTTATRVKSVAVYAPGVIIGTWTQAGASPTMIQEHWVVLPVDSGTSPVRIVGYTALRGSNRFVLNLLGELRNTGYRLVYEVRRPFARSTAVLRDTLRFNALSRADTVGPRLLWARPSGEVDLQPTLSLLFSEPVRVRVPGFVASDSLGDTVTVQADTAFCDTVYLTIGRRLRTGREYRVQIPFDAFEDMSGNKSPSRGDTASVTLRLRTVLADKLCMSLAGRGECLPEVKNLRWMLNPLGSGQKTGDWAVVADSAGTFFYDSIPAGRITLAVFDDRDGDRRPTAGRLFPWQPPELYLPLPDTVEARARWDVSGVAVSGCRVCTKPASPVAAPAKSPKPE